MAHTDVEDGGWVLELGKVEVDQKSMVKVNYE